MKLLLLSLFFITKSILPTSWQTDMELAKKTAQEDGKEILMVFSGSDWCAPCKKLKKNILLSDEFSQYAKDHLVILYLDFPAKKKNKLSEKQTQHNEALAEVYNSSGAFPNILLLKADGSISKQVSYKGQSPQEFLSQIK